jgi:hypothetical protein
MVHFYKSIAKISIPFDWFLRTGKIRRSIAEVISEI